MTILFIATLISSLGAVALAVYAWKHNRGKQVNRYFAIMSIFMALWVFVFYLSQIYYHILTVRITMLLVVIFFFYMFLFMYSFVFETVPKKTFQLLCGITVINAVVAISPFQFTHSEIINGEFIPIPGWGIFLFAFYSLAIVFISCGLLLHNFSTQEVTKRSQTKFILCGFLITFGTLIFTNLYGVNVLHTRAFFPLGIVSILAFISSSAYAMTRYRFLDVRIVMKKSLIYGGLLLLLCSLYIFVIFSLYSLTAATLHVYPFIWLIVSLLLFVGLFDYGKLRIKRFLDGIFFCEEVDFFKLIHNSKMVLNSTHELGSFIIKLAGSIQEVIQAPVQEILVRQEHMNRLKSFFPTHSKYYIPFDESVLKDIIQLRRRYLFLDELKEQGEAPSVQSIMKKKNAKLCMVIAKRGSVFALVLIGEHKNKKQFTRRDIRGLKEFHDLVLTQLPLLLHWQHTIENAKAFLHKQDF